MMLSRILSSLVLALPAVLAAQIGGYGVAGMEDLDGKSTPPAQAPATPNLCPVSIEASHLADGNAVRIGTGQDQIHNDKSIGQRLHLKLHEPDARTIASATVNVRGLTAKGRATPVGSSDAALEMRTLNVPFTAGANRTVWADIRAPGLTVVVSVELAAVKFSDGSTWAPPAEKTCSVAPEMLMLVTQR